jgi:hypothetical protein
MTFILTAIGTLLLLVSLVGVAFGAYMAADPKTREPGKLFAAWWVPAAAAASGVFMQDVVTFAVGGLCFLAAGVVFIFEDGRAWMRKARTPAVRHADEKREDSEKTTRENRATDNRTAS